MQSFPSHTGVYSQVQADLKERVPNADVCVWDFVENGHAPKKLGPSCLPLLGCVDLAAAAAAQDPGSDEEAGVCAVFLGAEMLILIIFFVLCRPRTDHWHCAGRRLGWRDVVAW